mmetsp:Transcript_108590/g.306968  ORF Transcript_108590/g.306968 Transcript_108590/m.306968 type:complete len:304 (-) Transcript_108590:694-1605(-)
MASLIAWNCFAQYFWKHAWWLCAAATCSCMLTNGPRMATHLCTNSLRSSMSWSTMPCTRMSKKRSGSWKCRSTTLKISCSFGSFIEILKSLRRTTLPSEMAEHASSKKLVIFFSSVLFSLITSKISGFARLMALSTKRLVTIFKAATVKNTMNRMNIIALTTPVLKIESYRLPQSCPPVVDCNRDIMPTSTEANDTFSSLIVSWSTCASVTKSRVLWTKKRENRQRKKQSSTIDQKSDSMQPVSTSVRSRSSRDARITRSMRRILATLTTRRIRAKLTCIEMTSRRPTATRQTSRRFHGQCEL